MGNYSQTFPHAAGATVTERPWLAGALAGLIGGIVMAMFAMTVTAIMGQGVWMPLRLIAASILGVDALVGGVGVLMAGLIMHMMASVIFGLIFAAIVGAAGPAMAFGAGIVYGIVIWAGMTYIGLPIADPTMQARVVMMGGPWFVEHLIFGGMLFLTPLLAHAMRRS